MKTRGTDDTLWVGERLALALESSKMGLWDLDLVNDKAFRTLEHDQVFGYEELLPEWGFETFLSHVVPEDRELVKQRFEEAYATGAFRMECRIIRRDKAVRWIAARGRAFRDEQGKLIRMMGSVADITETRRVEEELARQQDMLASFFTMALDMMCIASVDGNFKRVSPTFSALGYTPEELLSRSFLDFVHPDDLPGTLAEVEKLAKGARSTRFENRYRCKDGSYRWLSWVTAADSLGTLYAIARDVTDTRREHEALRQANQFLDAIIENIPHMVFVKDAERLAFARFNRAGEELLGVRRAEIIGKSDYDIFPKEEADCFQAKDRETLKTNLAVEIPEERIQTARGQRVLRTKKVPITDASGTPRYLLGISEDITERKAAEEARARLAAIVESSADAIVSETLDGIITSWNIGAQEVFGYTADEVIGRPVAFLYPPGRVNEERELHERLRRGERVHHFETVRRRKDGCDIDVSVSLSPIVTASGEMIGISKIARDITEAKRLERENARAKAATEAANRELESFSYSVAHDLRAPLRSIDGFSQALLEDCADALGDDGRRYLGLVRESAQLMAELIDDMLTLSRVTRQELERKEVDLSALARAALARLERTEPGRVVDVVIQDGIVCEADPRLLAVVLDNLLGNAWKFTSKRERARIELGATTRDGAPVYFVRDDGAGFDMAYANKLFGVFQRLHTVHEFDGTGVGLATVQRIVHRHGGHVWAEGKVDEGATIYFTLGDREVGA